VLLEKLIHLRFAPQPKRFIRSLRFKITVGIALPLVVILSAYSYLQYVRQRELLLTNLDRATIENGEGLSHRTNASARSQCQHLLGTRTLCTLFGMGKIEARARTGCA
jgi:hypothetical protein